MLMTRQRLGAILMGLWFICTALIVLLNLNFTGIEMVMAIFALIVGGLLIAG